MPRLPLHALLLACLALGLGARPGAAEDPPAAQPDPTAKPGADKPGSDKPGADKPGEPDDGADDKISFAEEINRALEQGTSWLKAKPRTFEVGNGTAAHWGLVKGERIYGGGDGPQYRHPAGPTALALYTLLKCGVDPKDPVITEGFHWLKVVHNITEENDGQAAPQFSWHHTQAGGSYEISVMTLALCAKYDHYKRNKNSAEGAKSGKLKITDKDDLDWLRALVDGLMARRGMGLDNPAPEARRGWRYNVPKLTLSAGNSNWTRDNRAPPHANQDLSSTQLAALALYSAHRFGVKVEPEVWWDILDFALSCQEETGPERKRNDPGYTTGGYAPPVDHARGFMYIKGSPDGSEGKATGSMTACGIGTILIAKEVLCQTEKGRKKFLEAKLDKQVETAVNDGLAWLDLHWSSFRNPESQYGYPIYYLYSLERAMDILGKRLVGSHLWYTEGARSILDNAQKARVKERQKKGTKDVDGMFWMTNSTHEPKDVLDTCFALLFLKRATQGLVPQGAVTGGDAPPADNR